jgi:hypothetical protein
LGESIFSANDPGVAKVVINDDIFVRAYGFFPHPNILGGFLVVSLLATMTYFLFSARKMFHVEQFSGIWLYRVIIFTQMTALLLSFSKSAWLAFAIGLLVLIYSAKKLFHVEQSMNDTKIVPRGTLDNETSVIESNCSTWNNLELSIMKVFKKLFHVEQFAVIGGIILFGMVIFFLDLKLFLIQPSVERLFYMNALTGLAQDYFIQGVGIGQFVLTMQQFFAEKLLIWQFQPIHNVFLLIFSETGIVGLGLFLWFFVYAGRRNNKSVPRGTFAMHQENCSTWNNRLLKSENASMFHVEHGSMSSYGSSVDCEGDILASLLRSILAAVTVIMLFDHYFWDIQQGQLLLWIILALAVVRK